jgi:hypothetical protein
MNQHWAYPFYHVARIAHEVWWCKGDVGNLDKMKISLAEHEARIRKIVPQERLLEWQVTDGWQPLCEFLGREVPVQPFPRVNDGQAIRKMLNAVILMRGVKFFSKYLVAIGVPVAALVWAWKLRAKL